jgi:hypothetical protein
MPEPEVAITIASLGRTLAARNRKESVDWGDEDFADYAFTVGVVVRRVSWRSGSVAGIVRTLDWFVGYDDAGRYGPFRSFAEAVKELDFSDAYDSYLENWTHPNYQQP